MNVKPLFNLLKIWFYVDGCGVKWEYKIDGQGAGDQRIRVIAVILGVQY